ncbi:MAG: mechanosensitive ion channel family protein [Chloroflexi bacterium]|nr:mechanosensitive ion channel family protein [Chloroflexota bacterium]
MRFETPFLIAGWDEVADWVLTGGLRIALIIGLLVAVYLAFRMVFPRLVRGMVLREEPDEELRKRVDTLVSVGNRTAFLAAFLVAVITILPEAGVNITAILTGLGITGLALALGAQTLVRDGINGIFILVENQYRQGDVVKVADVWGTVEEISLRRTLVRDWDGALHSVPNGAISVVSNYTRDYARINLEVRVAYGEDLGRASELIERVGGELAAEAGFKRYVVEAPKVVRVESVSDAGVSLRVMGVTRPGQQWDVTSELRRRILEAFVSEGIRVPFPPHVVAAPQG